MDDTAIQQGCMAVQMRQRLGTAGRSRRTTTRALGARLCFGALAAMRPGMHSRDGALPRAVLRFFSYLFVFSLGFGGNS